MTYIRNKRAHRQPKHKMVKFFIFLVITGVIAFVSIEVVRSVTTNRYANELLIQVRPMIQDKPYVESISIDNFDKTKRSIEVRLNESFNKLSTEERHLFLRDEIYSPIAGFFSRWSLSLPHDSLFFKFIVPAGYRIQVIAYSGNQVYRYGKFTNSHFRDGKPYISFDKVFIDRDGEEYEFANEQEKAEEYAKIGSQWNNSSSNNNEVVKIGSHSSDALQCSNCGRYYEPGDVAGNYLKIAVSSFCHNCYEIYKIERYILENYD